MTPSLTHSLAANLSPCTMNCHSLSAPSIIPQLTAPDPLDCCGADAAEVVVNVKSNPLYQVSTAGTETQQQQLGPGGSGAAADAPKGLHWRCLR